MPNTSLREELEALPIRVRVKSADLKRYLAPETINQIEALLTAKTTEALQGASEKSTPQEEAGGKQVVKLCEYRDHICQVVEEYGDDEYDLKLLAEPLVEGGLVECDCARELFSGVRVMPSDIVATVIDLVVTDLEATTPATQIRQDEQLQQLSKEDTSHE